MIKANSSERPLGDISRRTIVKGAAWSVPVIAAAAAAPARANSTTPCQQLPQILPTTAWTLTDPVSGRGQNNGAVSSWRVVDGVNGFRQYNDNYYRRTNPAAVDYVTSLSANFTAVAGQQYVFTFRMLGNTGGSQENIVTTVEVNVGGTGLGTWSTQPGVRPGTQVPMGPVNATTGSQILTVTWTAPSSGPAVFAYIFTMAPVGTRQLTYNDDIWVGTPTITAPGLCV